MEDSRYFGAAVPTRVDKKQGVDLIFSIHLKVASMFHKFGHPCFSGMGHKA